MKFSAQVQKILKAAKSYAERHKHEFLTPEHLLLQLISVKKIENLLESCGSNVSMVRESLYRYLDEKLPIIIVGETVESAGFQSVILSATEHCFFCEKEAIELEDLLISIYDCEKTHASYYLKSSGLQRLALISGISFSEYSEDEADENDTELESDALKENLSQSKEDDEKEEFKYLEKKIMRAMIKDEGVRADGRKLTEVRPIWCEVSPLPFPHGSAIFTRGETQALATATLGSKLDEKLVDGALEKYYSKFRAFLNPQQIKTIYAQERDNAHHMKFEKDRRDKDGKKGPRKGPRGPRDEMHKHHKDDMQQCNDADCKK